LSSYDIAVVGNGAVGLSLGLQLAERHTRVVVVGEPQRRWCASAAAGAMLGCFGEVTAIGVQSPQGRARVELAYRASKLWPDWLARICEDKPGLVTATGTVVLLNAATVADVDDANFQTIANTLTGYKEPFEEIDPRALEWVNGTPALRPLRALHIPGEHAVDATRLLGCLQSAFERAGGVLKRAMADRVKTEAGAVTGLSLRDGDKISAKIVVLAAGAATQTLLDGLPDTAVQIPRLLSGFGTSLLLKGRSEGPRQVIRTPNRSFGCGLHVVPRGGADVYIGASNIIQGEPGETPIVQDVASLMSAASEQLRRDLWFSEIVRIQTGNRPVSLDGFPLLGPVDIDGLWLITGMNRDGLHLSPYLSAEFADWILENSHDPILDSFRPQRRPIEALSRDASIRSAALQIVSLGHERGWNVPPEWTRALDQQMVAVFQAVAHRVSDAFTPPPEILSAARNSNAVAGFLCKYYAACERLTALC
jgi:glycine oxidase